MTTSNGRFHRITIAGVTRDLPIVQTNTPGTSIALFDILDDVVFAEIAGAELAKQIPDSVGAIISVEGKSMALAHVIAREKNRPLVTIRKGDPKRYAQSPVVLTTAITITTGVPQKYWTECRKLQLLRGKDVAIVDDVISTGATLRVLRETIAQAEGRFVGAFCVFTEGETATRPGVVALGHLPLFHD